MRGFTLLEVMVALAIMAGVVLTVLGAVNYHISIIANERDNTTLTLLARARMAEMELSAAPLIGSGTFAPSRPDFTWKTELLPAKLPGLQCQVLRVQHTGDKKEVALVRYLPK
jgi:general secretion pathway protein I